MGGGKKYFFGGGGGVAISMYLRWLKNSRVLTVLSKIHRKPSYNGSMIYMKMFETIVVLNNV